MAFASPVAVPSTRDYAAPEVDFSILGNLYNTYQQSQQNNLKLQQQKDQLQQQQKLRALFQNGLPLDAQGNIDYRAVTQAMAKAGDTSAITELYPAVQTQQNRGVTSPLIPDVGDLPPTSGQPSSQPPSQPSPGAPGQGPSVVDIVAGKLGDENAGPVIGRVAQAMGINPNQALTPGQQKRAQGLLSRYAPDSATAAPTAPASSPVAPAASPAAFDARWAQFSGPQAMPAAPSVLGAPVAPPAAAPAAAPVAPPTTAAPVAPAAPVAGPQAAPQPQPQPIGPQVPLPKDPRTGRPFTDPEQAILALQSEASRIGSQNPVRAAFLKEWAQRIAQSIKPIEMSAGKTLIDPRTGQVLVGGQGGLTGQALEDAARVYVETGKFPPNMGRGIQGTQDRNNILERASGMENEMGLDPRDRAARWQQYATHAAGLRVLETRAANLTLVEDETKTLIPRVRDLIGKVNRTRFPDLNKIIIAAQTHTGDPNEIRLGLAIQSLIPVYARLLKPTGTIGVTDTENARDLLVKSWSDGQMNAALDQMEVERAAARQALEDARKEFGASPGAKPSTDDRGTQPAKPSSGPVGKPDAQGWITLPNGVRIREKPSTAAPNGNSA